MTQRLSLIAWLLLISVTPAFAQQIEGQGGGAALTVKENDNLPTVSNVTSISVNNGTLTDNGGGSTGNLGRSSKGLGLF